MLSRSASAAVNSEDAMGAANFAVVILGAVTVGARFTTVTSNAAQLLQARPSLARTKRLSVPGLMPRKVVLESCAAVTGMA